VAIARRAEAYGVAWNDAEVVLVSLAAMLSPLTLMWSVLALVLSKRPVYTGVWFYLGALIAALAIGVAGAFVVGDLAASHHPSSPKTWVAVIDLVAGVLLLVWVVRMLRKPVDPAKQAGMIAKMRTVASSAWIAVFAAGAVLANPGVFIPLALKAISETDPSKAGYLVEWMSFTLVSLLPLGVAIVMLFFAREWAERILGRARDWLERYARIIAAAIVIVLALSLLRGGFAGLTS
jgi:Sap, sulfolipid-1-addressing protein